MGDKQLDAELVAKVVTSSCATLAKLSKMANLSDPSGVLRMAVLQEHLDSYPSWLVDFGFRLAPRPPFVPLHVYLILDTSLHAVLNKLDEKKGELKTSEYPTMINRAASAYVTFLLNRIASIEKAQIAGLKASIVNTIKGMTGSPTYNKSIQALDQQLLEGLERIADT